MQADVYAEARRRVRVGVLTHPVRGLLHGTAAVASLVAIPTLLGAVEVSDGRRIVLTVYGVCLVGLFTVSALYHSVPWGPDWKRRMRRADHTMIYVFIAAALSPFAFVLTDGWMRGLLIGSQWLLVSVGIAEKLLVRRVGMGFSTTLQTIQGWSGLLIAVPVVEQLPPAAWSRLLIVGALYTIGMVMVVTGRPRLWEHVFSYHEVFHILVIIATAIHLWVVLNFVAPFPG